MMTDAEEERYYDAIHKYDSQGCDGYGEPKPRVELFVQIRPYYDGLEHLVQYAYCKTCLNWAEVRRKQ